MRIDLYVKRMQSGSVCVICHEGGHSASKCPELWKATPGGGGGGGHSHDDDDDEKASEKASQKAVADNSFFVFLLSKLTPDYKRVRV
jgi:hypothetical protein